MALFIVPVCTAAGSLAGGLVLGGVLDRKSRTQAAQRELLRTFTLEEAQSLLPVLESLLRTAIDGKKLIETVDAELQDLARHRRRSGDDCGAELQPGRASRPR